MGQLNKSSTFFTSLFLLTVAVAFSSRKGFMDTSIAFKFFDDEVFWSLRRLSVVGLMVVVTGSIKKNKMQDIFKLMEIDTICLCIL